MTTGPAPMPSPARSDDRVIVHAPAIEWIAAEKPAIGLYHVWELRGCLWRRVGSIEQDTPHQLWMPTKRVWVGCGLEWRREEDLVEEWMLTVEEKASSRYHDFDNYTYRWRMEIDAHFPKLGQMLDGDDVFGDVVRQLKVAKTMMWSAAKVDVHDAFRVPTAALNKPPNYNLVSAKMHADHYGKVFADMRRRADDWLFGPKPRQHLNSSACSPSHAPKPQPSSLPPLTTADEETLSAFTLVCGEAADPAPIKL
jgi:hypothetical protein